LTPVSGHSSVAVKRPGPDRHSRPQVLLAFDDHTFTRPQPSFDHPHCARALTDLNRADGDPVVTPDDVNLVTALLLDNGGLRNQ
jgi:LmbE family N-acetylglucosaminyl deacetylase